MRADRRDLLSMSAWSTEYRRILELSAPLIVTQVGHMALGVTDILMVGELGKDAIAAVTLGHVWVWGTFIFGMGLVFGMDPIATQAWGRKDRAALSLVLVRGSLFSLVVAVPIGLSWCFAGPALEALGQSPELASLAHDYVVVQVFGLPPYIVFTALRQYYQAKGILRPILWVSLISVPMNVLFNWLFIFGNLGCPELGIVGAGIATSLTRIFLLVALCLGVLRDRDRELTGAKFDRRAFALSGHLEIAHYGWPIALQFGAEVWAFQIASLMAGKIGTAALAAHGIVLNLAGLTFMVPLGVSLGTVVRVGNLIGEGRYRRAHRASWVAFVIGMGFTTLSALAFFFGRRVLAELFNDSEDVIALAVAIFPIAAAFQWFDGTQVIGSGVLRGMGRARPAAIFNLVGYYLVALPVGYWLAFVCELGLRGIWWGCAVGLGTVAGSLVAWVAWNGPTTLRR
jgi:MATE family multidrug resistance protein